VCTKLLSELISSADSKEFLEYAVKLDLLLFKEIPGDDAFKYLSRDQFLRTLNVNIQFYLL